jgi:hypothetical protein
MTLPWLPGYEGSTPVRIGNAAGAQLQLDVYGEVLDAFYAARRVGLSPLPEAWQMTRTMLAHLETVWCEPDEGIWEVRGQRRHFTHSKVMVWVAFDRAVRAAEEFSLEGPIDHWRAVRDAVKDQACELGFDPEQNSFTQSYGHPALDASLLRLPLVGFLPADDPRIRGTVAAIERQLMEDGLVLRYLPDAAVEGLPPTPEGSFLACTAWLGEVYAMQGRTTEAMAVLDRLVGLANDVGLLAEEYDTHARRQAWRWRWDGPVRSVRRRLRWFLLRPLLNERRAHCGENGHFFAATVHDEHQHRLAGEHQPLLPDRVFMGEAGAPQGARPQGDCHRIVEAERAEVACLQLPYHRPRFAGFEAATERQPVGHPEILAQRQIGGIVGMGIEVAFRPTDAMAAQHRPFALDSELRPFRFRHRQHSCLS